MKTPAERVHNVMEQCILNGDILRFCCLKQHGVQHRSAGEQAESKTKNDARVSIGFLHFLKQRKIPLYSKHFQSLLQVNLPFILTK